MSNVGDLGRRVLERRRELGLTPEALASLAGMDAAYVRRIETSASPQLSREALRRMAVALETTTDALSGGGFLAPPGRVDPSDRPFLDILDPDECWALVGSGGVGRVVFSEPRGPVAMPVNFRMSGHDVFFRTAPSSALMASVEQGQVSFEVDHIDEVLIEGWSVLISGESRVVNDPEKRQRAQALGIVPWAGGERDVYVSIVSSEVTGRRIRHL